MQNIATIASNLACGRQLCAQLVAVLVLYQLISNLNNSRESFWHSRYVDCDVFYAAAAVSKPAIPTITSQPLRSTSKSLRVPLTNTALLMSSCYLLQEVFLATILISISNDISVNPGPLSTDFPRFRGLKIAHLNVRSLTGKIDSLRIFLKENPFDVLTLSETWLKANVSDSEIFIPGYTLLRNDRDSHIGGGTLAYIHDGLPYCVRSDLQAPNVESCVVEINRAKARKLFIFTLYKAA